MKKFTVAAMAALIVFTCCGCSFLTREASPQSIVKEYIDVSDSGDAYESAARYIAEERSGAIVSILSTYYITSGGRTEKQTVSSSGIVLNSDGYILTSASVGTAQVSGQEYSASKVSAVLAPVYRDDSLYTLREIDSDSESGLALYKFYDNFYYTDESGVQKDGLQFTAQLSENEVKTGDSCWAVGNSLGDLFSEAYDLTITGGIVSDEATDTNIFSLTYNEKQYSFMQTTVPTTPEMLGSGLFDENGYLIGMFSSKIVSESNGSQNYLDRSSLFYKTDIIQDYINSVSQELQTVIRYSVASSNSEEADA